MKEKEKREKEKLTKLASLEGGTPSNTPPPLTPAHTITQEQQKEKAPPISPLALDSKKPSLTRQDAAMQEPPASSAPPAPAAAVEETKTDTENAPKLDKNGKVVKAAAESNGNNDIAAASAKSSNHKAASSTQRKNTKSKLCNIL